MSSIESVTDDDVYIIKKNDIIPKEKPLSMIGNGKVSCNESDVVLEKNLKNELKSKESEQYGVKDSSVETPTKQKTPIKKQKKLVIFFRDYYFRFVTHKVIRWILLPIFAVFVIVFGYQASKLEADNEQVSISLKFFVPSDCKSVVAVFAISFGYQASHLEADNDQVCTIQKWLCFMSVPSDC